jgi:hypothetical protein
MLASWMVRHRLIYCGWIEGYEQDRQRLRSFGVYGPMRFKCTCDDGRGIFEICYASKSTISILIDVIELEFPGSFVAIDAITKEVLPKMYQPTGVTWTQQDLYRHHGMP